MRAGMQKKGRGAMELGKPGIGAGALPFHVYLSASSARLEVPGLVEKMHDHCYLVRQWLLLAV